MLTNLSLENIAVIERLEMEFQRGFNVLTGETAAGKSIIITAINMALGGRVSRDVIRAGADKSVVQAVFWTEKDGDIIVRREVFADGRNVCKVNGEFVTVSRLREITENLVNIHGQHDNQALLNPARHMDILDEFADVEIEKSEYQDALNKHREIEKRISALKIDEAAKAQRVDMLRFQLSEIDSVSPKEGEDTELGQMRDRAANREKIMAAANSAYDVIYAGENAMVDALAASSRELCGAGLEELSKAVEELKINADDIAHRLSDYITQVENDDEDLEKIEERLHTIFQLKRKYGAEIKDILQYRVQISEELCTLESSEATIAELERDLAEADETLAKKAAILTDKRKKAAEILREKVCAELADLEMAKVKFDVDIKSVDSAEFLIATNSGEGLKPLAKIASGGELSRISLAIKSTLAETDATDTLVFDEIDTGISGRAAQKTAEKLAKIGKLKQILCITHLAQIAGMASTHFRISKEEVGGRTFAKVAKLDGTGREQELARIMGGVRITELTLQSAREMLEMAGHEN